MADLIPEGTRVITTEPLAYRVHSNSSQEHDHWAIQPAGAAGDLHHECLPTEHGQYLISTDDGRELRFVNDRQFVVADEKGAS